MPSEHRSLVSSPLRRWWPVDGVEVRIWTGVMTLLVVLLGYLVIDKSDDWHGLVQTAIDKGRKPKLEEVGWGWLWVATVINLGMAGVLWLLVPVWAQPSSMKAGAEEKACVGRRWCLWVLVMVCLGLAVRAPRMGLSLYNDEAHNYSRLFAGNWERESLEAAPVYDEARWGETFWRNSGGNNAQPYTILARLSLEAAMAMGAVQLGEVSEWAVRLPSLLAGLLSIALAGWLARRCWGHWPGVVTMLVLVLHPWHLRHSTEARGQSLLLLGVLICFCCLAAALANGRWRAWLGYGFGLFLCASSFIGSVYFLAAMSAAVLIRQLVLWRAGWQGVEQVARPLLASVFGAMLGIELMVPILPELIQILASNPAFRGEMGLSWWQDEFGFAWLGTRWTDSDVGNPDNLALTLWAVKAPWLWTLCLLAWIGAVIRGTVKMVQQGGVARLLAVSTWIGVPLTWGIASLQGNYLNLWYLYFVVPALAVAMGGAVKGVRPLAAGLWVLLMVAPLMKIDAALWDTPKQDNRWPVEVARGAAYPGYLAVDDGDAAMGEPITAAFWCNADLYDAHMMVLKDPADLRSLIMTARGTGRPLWVCFGHEPLARATAGDLVALLEDEAVFEKVGVRYGLEEYQFALHLYRLR